MKRVILAFLLTIFYLLFSTSPIFAAPDCYETVTGGEQVATLSCLGFYAQKIIAWVFPLAGLVFVAMFIFGGIKFILSGGDPKQAEGARNTLTWAVAGLILILLSFAILRLISLITGVKFLWLPF